jgi:hypothetical protein
MPATHYVSSGSASMPTAMGLHSTGQDTPQTHRGLWGVHWVRAADSNQPMQRQARGQVQRLASWHAPAGVDLRHVVALARDGAVLGDLVLLVRLLSEAALAGHAVTARVDGAARVVHGLVLLARVVRNTPW